MNGLVQKNNVNDLRLEHIKPEKNSIKKFDYSEFIKGMTEEDLKSDDFLAYESSHIRSVRGRLKINIPLYVSSFTKENADKQMSVRWQLCTRDKYLNEITVSEGMLTADYKAESLTYIGDIKLTTPMQDALGILKMWLIESDTEEIVMRSFVLFDIRHKKANIYYPDYTDISASGLKNTKIIGNGEGYYAEGSGTLLLPLCKQDITEYKYGCMLEVLFEASNIKKDTTIKVFINNILLEKRTFKKLPDKSFGVLSELYLKDEEVFAQTNCGYMFKCLVPSFVLKGLPNYFNLRIETDGGIVLFGRKCGRYPLGFEIRAIDRYKN